LSFTGHARVLKVAAHGQWAGVKSKGQKAKLRKDKNKGGRDKLPLTIDFITKEHKLFTRGLPP